jgi:hypothetical protein
MSFSRDLKYVLNADSSTTAYATGGILYENLPENFELSKNWIVYSFNKNSLTSCLSGISLFTTYNIVVKVVTTDTLTLENISDRLVTYLHSSSYGGIQDIIFQNDNHSMDLDKNIYMNTLQFTSIYA